MEYNPQCGASILYKLMHCRGAVLHAFELHSGRVHEQWLGEVELLCNKLMLH